MSKTNIHLAYQKIILVFLCSMIFSPILLIGQVNRNSLEKERMEIIQRIEETDKKLRTNLNQQQSTEERYKLIQSKIKDREKLLSTIQGELIQSDAKLDEAKFETNQLAKQQESIRERYYLILNQLYKRTLSHNKWNYILNAQSINDSFLRWRYVKQYEAYILEMHDKLEIMNLNLKESQETWSAVRQERLKLLETEQNQFELIKKEMQEVETLLSSLKNNTEILREELKQQKYEREKLNQAIEAIILSVLQGENEESSSHIGVSKNVSPRPSSASNADSKLDLSGNFSNFRGRLPHPVPGRIISKFGKQRHPTFKDLEIQNNGIDIECEIGTYANAIFGGQVAGIREIQGFGYVIIVKHNGYYSVYSKLNSSFVSKGDTIESGNALGQVMVENGKGILHLEIWKGKQKLNPGNWLK